MKASLLPFPLLLLLTVSILVSVEEFENPSVITSTIPQPLPPPSSKPAPASQDPPRHSVSFFLDGTLLVPAYMVEISPALCRRNLHLSKLAALAEDIEASE
ncbi:hypothetical protein GQ43DRAFT_431273 [Delitschia confertaspora ATCC 74209]|uniref:Uncharacterized protein n=1 Tax=Delitschia confertaspora ATCC 74209 TaxID=1513339 RepID=A0A9P4MT93_9PLEO|nr:hypothetical protein GQ43DRAFT_431273 [Delitschia confertaspora ATCC 74209]